MLKRTVTGLLIIATVAGALALGYFVDPIAIDLYILLWMAVGTFEMFRCFKNAGRNMHKLPAVIMLVASYPVFYCCEHFAGADVTGLTGLMVVFFAAVLTELAMFTLGDQAKNGLVDLTANIFILIYPVLIVSLAWIMGASVGIFYLLLFAVFMPIGADTLAYFTGRLIGKKKLCPAISPKKTVEGAIGGLFGGMAVSVIFWAMFEYAGLFPAAGYVPFVDHAVEGWEWKSALIYLAIGIAGSVLSEIGDLIASRIKRELGIKDYGNIFPGHGGVMDRLDSIMSGLITLFLAFTIIYGI